MTEETIGRLPWRAIWYWIDQKVHSGFSIKWYIKTRTNFLANPIEIRDVKEILVNAQKEVNRMAENTCIILENTLICQEQNVTEIWTLTGLLVKSQEGNERCYWTLEGRQSLLQCSKTDMCSNVGWKVELVSDEPECLVEISKQNGECIYWFLLANYGKMWEKGDKLRNEKG